jgi:hypothetical protein
LTESCPKNGDIPKSPLPKKWQPGAVGRRDFNPKIDLVRVASNGISRQHCSPITDVPEKRAKAVSSPA